MSSKVRIVGVSDVSVGYGSSLILYFMESLIEHYSDAEGILIEPDQPDRPPKHEWSSALSVERIFSTFHPHHSVSGRIEYIYRASEIVNKLRPDILVIYCTFALPVLFKLGRRPSLVIYYAYEMTYPYGSFDIEMNRCINASLVDVIIYPEENRAIQELKLCGHRDTPVVTLYNCQKGNSVIIPAHLRNGRIFYAGTIDAKRTFAYYYFHDMIQSIPIDLFGVVTGADKEALRQRLGKLSGMLRYLGYLERETLQRLRKAYCYSITMWNPIDDQHLYAAPNKFFEAIADGVPPITAPHPQCKMIVQRYKCGIIMEDWSFDAFYAAIQRALKIYGTDLYDKMVENCRKAFAEELSWEKQFEKVKPYLPDLRSVRR